MLERDHLRFFIADTPILGLTEEQIIHVFSQVGQVTSFRLVYDRETGRPKGFGFAEYQDADSAASAVRNLNDHDIMGRKLRVDFSNDGGAEDAAPAGYVPQPLPPMPITMNGLPPPPQPQSSGLLPPLPPGVDVPLGLTCPEAISRTLTTLPSPQLLDILAQMKGLAMSDPHRATELFKQAPQLAYAIFQSLLLLGLVDPSALQSVIEQSAAHTAQTQHGQSMYPGLPAHLGGVANAPTPPPVPPGFMPPSAPPVGVSLTPQPLAVAPAAAPGAGGAIAGLDKAALVQYVLSMTQDQINALQPAEREQLMMVRQSIMSGQLRI